MDTMMNRDNEEQKPVPQTLCGALQKEANCKCLVLSVLIYGCLAAVTWCRCANVSKIVINFSTFPIKTTKYVSPCDEGYIYIPVAFMGMLYLVYLVECYHSPIRIDLLHAEGQSNVIAKLTQLKMAQPTIWWKAISYHYVRRKRQIMRYRNGDNFTTTQVYYERVNSHAATSFYFYDYCGSKDISKELILDPKIPITKITLSKGFAFSNVRSATEFEEARSRFFAEQEFRDDYMEMREGLDLGCNFNPTTLIAVLGNPWFTRSYVYWCLSALLLSWPLRIIIECNTQYVDYQVTKLFGVNYDTPTNIQIHTSASQLSAPGSYMLAPSYSEALLMEPAALSNNSNDNRGADANNAAPKPEPSDMVPSYSEALLYECASAEHQPGSSTSYDERPPQYQRTFGLGCECPCHGLVDHGADDFISQESLQINEVQNANTSTNSAGSNRENVEAAGASGNEESQRLRQVSTEQDSPSVSCPSNNSFRVDARICDSCLNDAASERRSRWIRRSATNLGSCDLEIIEANETRQPRCGAIPERQRRCILREYSEPDLRRSSELLGDGATNFLHANGRSLENIMENEETENPLNQRTVSERAETQVAENSDQNPSGDQQQQQQQQQVRSTGAIPKRIDTTKQNSNGSSNSSNSSSSRVTVNPIAEAVKRMPSSRSTYFCLKSILKQNRRRFTLVTPEELQSLTHGEHNAIQINDDGDDNGDEECTCDGCTAELERPDSLKIDKQRPLSCQSISYRRENSRTLIFASPIQVVCPSDPYGGRNIVPSENPPNYEEALNLPVLSRLRRSLTDRDSSTQTAPTPSTSSSLASTSKTSQVWKHRRTMSTDPQQIASFSSDNTCTALITSTQQGRSETAISLPSYDGLTVPPDAYSSTIQASTTTTNIDERSPFLRLDELAAPSTSNSSAAGPSRVNEGKNKSRLTRSQTERRREPESRRHNKVLRKSYTERVDTNGRIAGVKRTNINIETSL